jgi:hypothetical protein
MIKRKLIEHLDWIAAVGLVALLSIFAFTVV